MPQFNKLRIILNTPIIGNAHSDRQLFNAIDSFIISEYNSMPDKILAIKKLDQAMGITDDNVTEQSVQEYIDGR